MVSLLDIVPSVETVDVGGEKIAVHGVSATGLAYLIRRFPELLSGGIGVEMLMSVGGEAVAAVIACGCGYHGNEVAEGKAASFSLDVQADLLAAILRLTMPQGVGPFVEKLAALKAAIVPAPAGPPKAPVDGMRIRSKKRSAELSTDSSGPDTRPNSSLQ